ncbi:hypothetical protein K438DRAFT_1957082 [Mycena galopus ATCC 62051]|nr:hypothetical protein K438DRAFT_1957082 [Mycena galopus ATCC 62051]
MFAYLLPRARPTPRTIPDVVPKFPPKLMKAFFAAQEQQFSDYRRRLDQIHQEERRRKENPLLFEEVFPPVALDGDGLSVEQNSVSEDPDSVWDRLDGIFNDDNEIGNISPVAASTNSDSLLESPVYAEWLDAIHDGDERLNEDNSSRSR